MPDAITVSEAAAELGTSRQSILNFVRDGTLQARKGPQGAWRVRRDSVDRFLVQHGRLNGGRRRKSASAALQDEVHRLREQIGDMPGGDRTSRLIRERDDLRASVAALEDSLARLREASELQRTADAERSRVVDDLLAALGASQRADELRQRAIDTLEDGLTAHVMPGRLAGRADR